MHRRAASRRAGRLAPGKAHGTPTLVCCLDALDADHITVTDILTVATPDGLRTQLSAYPKLRLAPATVATWAASAGLALALDRDATDQGMHLQVFRAAS